MKVRSFCFVFVIIALLLATYSFAQAAQTVMGTAISSTGRVITVKPDGDGKVVLLKLQSDANILRGQLGMELRKATVADISPGDRIVAVVNQDGQVSSIKAFYSVTKGTLSMRERGRLFFKDGRFIKVASEARVVFAGGKIGKPEDLKPGAPLICRLNPTTEEAWLIVASEPTNNTKSVAAPKTKELPVAPVVLAAKPQNGEVTTKVKGFAELSAVPAYPNAKQEDTSAVRPVIESVTYTGPSSLKARDWIRVDVVGTPNGRAICEVKGLIPRTVMKEIEPGKYRASVMIPSNKFVHNQPLLAHLTVDGVDAPTVQASKLITVEPPVAEPSQTPAQVVASVPATEPSPASVPEPTPIPEPNQAAPPDPAPQPPVATQPPAPELPKTKAPVVLTAPVMGTRILRTLLITGTAEPESSVIVTVSYTNGLQGLLNLSGQVCSQLIAVNKDGRFQVGPLPLEGPLATRGLIFNVKAYYPDSEQTASVVSVFGDRD